MFKSTNSAHKASGVLRIKFSLRLCEHTWRVICRDNRALRRSKERLCRWPGSLRPSSARPWEPLRNRERRSHRRRISDGNKVELLSNSFWSESRDRAIAHLPVLGAHDQNGPLIVRAASHSQGIETPDLFALVFVERFVVSILVAQESPDFHRPGGSQRQDNVVFNKYELVVVSRKICFVVSLRNNIQSDVTKARYKLIFGVLENSFSYAQFYNYQPSILLPRILQTYFFRCSHNERKKIGEIAHMLINEASDYFCC